MSLITKLMNTNITMISQILHSKNVMKIIKKSKSKSFRHRPHLTASDLSKYYWKLGDKGAVPTIKFSIAKRVKGNTFINDCNLCLSEKAFIIRNIDDENMLNKRSEFRSKCRHINKRLLNRVKDDSND